MALFQSELAKNDLRKSAAPMASRQKMSVMRDKDSQFMSYVTLDNHTQDLGLINLEGASYVEKAGSSNKGNRGVWTYHNQTISHLMKNLDLIKNINKKNRLGSN